MLTAMLRNVGGSVMMAIPKPLLEGLGLAANTKVNLSIDNGRLIVEGRSRPKYSLSELLSQCDQTASSHAEESAWEDMPPAGDEVW